MRFISCKALARSHNRFGLMALLALGAVACRFEVTYPDSFAPPRNDAQSDQHVEPDSGLDATPDTAIDLPPDVIQWECGNPLDCEVAQGPSGVCHLWKCVDGRCQQTDAADTTPCDDQNLCTGGDACFAGECMGLGNSACPDDGDPCTEDFCDPATGYCASQPSPECGDCVTSADCPVGKDCVGHKCEGCGIEQCNSALDEDCDGMMDESPCQQWTCGFGASDYPGLPPHRLAELAAILDGYPVSTLGNLVMGPAQCNGTSCYAPLRLKDMSPAGDAVFVTLLPSDTYDPVECKGARQQEMTCIPTVPLGTAVLVWGTFIMDGPNPSVILTGYCQQ